MGTCGQAENKSAKNKDTMSALIVADAHCKQAKISIRDGVRVEHASGSAAMGAKFDVEVVERGTEFDLCLWNVSYVAKTISQSERTKS